MSQPTGTEAALCELIATRQRLGVAKYGTTVAENHLELRAWLQHALEECLDQGVYLKRAIEEIDAKAAERERPMPITADWLRDSGWSLSRHGLWSSDWVVGQWTLEGGVFTWILQDQDFLVLRDQRELLELQRALKGGAS